jgi:hypothetical protein
LSRSPIPSPGAPPPASSTARPRRGAAALAFLLALHAFLAVTSLRRNSVTMDEFAHLPAGLSYWQQRNFALYHHNPPLVKMLAALPVLWSGPAVDYGGSWARARADGIQPGHIDFGTEFMRTNPDRYFDLFNRGRSVIVLLSVLGGLLIFLWARDLWGVGGGLLAAALWALDPNVLAHAGLVTTDVAAAVAMLGAAYAFWRWSRTPTWRCAAAVGVVLGLAQLTKFSCMILYPLFALLTLVHWTSGGRSPERPRPSGIAAQGLMALALSLFVINLGYGFEGTGRLLGSFPFLSVELTVPRTGGEVPYHPNAFYQRLYEQRQNRFGNTWMGRLPTPLPAHYVLGLDEQRFETNIGLPGGGYAVYLRGRIQRSGWRLYYLWALALKVPPGTWMLLITAFTGALLRPSLRGRPADEMTWALPAATVLAGMSLMTGLDLGVRYVLPVLPFLFVGAGRLAPLLEGRRRGALIATCLLSGALFWNLVETLSTWPHYISYFNEAAGGPAGGHRYLIDSNLDWGQDLLELRRWLDAHPQQQPVALAYFGTVDPHIAGIAYRLPPRDPRVVAEDLRLPGELDGLRPGTYAISVNFAQGLPHRVLAESGDVVPADQDAFGYFRAVRPSARVGGSIWIYRLGERDVARIRRLWESGGAPERASDRGG